MLPPRALIRVHNGLWHSYDQSTWIKFHRWLMTEIHKEMDLSDYVIAAGSFTQDQYNFPKGTLFLDLEDNPSWSAKDLRDYLLEIDQRQFPKGTTQFWIKGQDGLYRVF